MNILFCCEGFIIDGVASYNLNMAAALRQAGHRVGILGRWLGPGGYQARHRRTGVDVMQYLSPTVTSPKALVLARKFKPDVIITDGRRAFPLALSIREKMNTPIVTNFMDSVRGKDKKGRSVEEIRDNSAAWVSPEIRWVEMARGLAGGLPVHQVRRAVMPELLPSFEMRSRDPFRILCLGRLSGYKFTGQKTVVRNALALRKAIPSLDITVVGGGWRRAVFMKDATVANFTAGKRFVHIVGYQSDSSPWIGASTIVCGGSTCGLEAILSNRPVIAMSAHWFGHITPENLSAAADNYYGERGGPFYVKENPGVVLDEIVRLYENWDDDKIRRETEAMRNMMLPHFSPDLAAKDWEELFSRVL